MNTMKNIKTLALNCNFKSQFKYQANSQKGAVLIIGLILLFSLTLLGIGAMSTNLLQQRMAANMGDATLAFNASDTLIRREQRWIRSAPAEAPLLSIDCNNNQRCIYDVNRTSGKNILVTSIAEEWWEDPVVLDQAWWNANAYDYCCVPIPVNLDNVLVDPRIIIEWQQYELDDIGLGTTSIPTGITYYRLTARGTGSTTLSESVIQATISKRWN